MCMVLAGYKEPIWDDVFARLKAYVPDNVDVCVLSSGLFNEKLNVICEENNWSYLSTKKNQLCYIQNLAIELHPNAEWIYKIDEDIFLTQGFFEKLMETWVYVEKNTDASPSIIAPLINVNGYTYVRLLDKCGLRDAFISRFEDIKYSSGIEHHKWTRDSEGFARYMWGSEEKKLADIDGLTQKFSSEELSISYCPVRFSIGAILFRRVFWDEMEGFPVDSGSGLGVDEERICWFAMNNSRPIVINENVVVGHLGFGPQTDAMMKYYRQNPALFALKGSVKRRDKVKIIVSCHKQSNLPFSTIYYPIEVGAANSSTHLVDCHRDDIGKNISNLNYSFSELTAQYWAWKNLDLEFYGQCHYRRYFYFGECNYDRNDHAQIEEELLDINSISKYEIDNDEMVLEQLGKFDLIAPLEWNVKLAPTPIGNKDNVKDHMIAYGLLTEADIHYLIKLTDYYAPEWSGYIRKYLEGEVYIGYNCFLMRKNLFQEFCEKEFCILLKFAERTSFDYLESRLCGYLGEILFSTYVLFCKDHGVKTKHCPLVFFREVTSKKGIPLQNQMVRGLKRLVPPGRNFFNRRFNEIVETLDEIRERE